LINKILVEVALAIDGYLVKKFEHFHERKFFYHFSVVHILSPVNILKESQRLSVGL